MMKAKDVYPNVKWIKQKVKCEVCKKEFESGDAHLEKKSPNISIFPNPLVNLKVIQYKGEEFVLCCPYCEAAHLFGFDKVSEVK